MIKGILRDEEESRDAMQELILRLWNKRKKLNECTNLDSYIISAARNHCFDLLKKKRPSRMTPKEELTAMNLESDEKSHEITEKHEQVLKIIESLPAKYREIIRLRDIDGFTFEEMNTMTGIEIPHLRVLLSRARMRVKSELLKIYEYEQKTTYQQPVGQVL